MLSKKGFKYDGHFIDINWRIYPAHQRCRLAGEVERCFTSSPYSPDKKKETVPLGDEFLLAAFGGYMSYLIALTL